MTLLERVSAALDAWTIPHALIGAAALAAAGIARSTFDVDVLVTDITVLARDWRVALGAPHVTVESRRGDDDDPLAGVVRFDADGERPVDLIVGRHKWQENAIARAARTPPWPPVVQPRDLVLLKLYAGGTQDLWDVRELLRVLGDGFAAEVEEDLQPLPRSMREAWARVRS